MCPGNCASVLFLYHCNNHLLHFNSLAGFPLSATDDLGLDLSQFFRVEMEFLATIQCCGVENSLSQCAIETALFNNITDLAAIQCIGKFSEPINSPKDEDLDEIEPKSNKCVLILQYVQEQKYFVQLYRIDQLKMKGNRLHPCR